MIRKLSHAFLAFSATGMALLVILASSDPVAPPMTMPATGFSGAPTQLASLELSSVESATDIDDETVIETGDAPPPRIKHRSRSTRELIAVPYFSFARDARGSRS